MSTSTETTEKRKDPAPLGSQPGTGLSGPAYARSACLILIVATAVLFSNLGAVPPTENKEIRVWKVTSEMSQTGDFLVPRIDGAPHLTKPPLYYWCAAACAKAAGGASLFEFRLPSVISCLAVIILVLAWGKASGGTLLSVLSAVLLFSMARFAYWARMGTFEVMLSLFCLLALLTFFYVSTRSMRALFPLVCLFAALAFLTKGTPVLMIVLLPSLVWLAVRRDFSLFARGATYIWLLLAVALSLSWYAVVMLRVPGALDIFHSELVLPLGTETDASTNMHGQPFWYYLARIWEITFPVCLFIPLCARRAWISRMWRDNLHCRFLFVVFATLFVAFSAIPGKQMHYLFPAFAPLAILVAESIHWGISSGDRFTVGSLKAFAIFWAIVLALCAVPVTFFNSVLVGMKPAVAAIIPVGLLVAALLLVVWLRRMRWGFVGLSFFLGTAVVFGFALDNYLVWQRQFQAGVAASRPDYDTARWERNFSRYPWLKRIFTQKVSHHGAAAPAAETGFTPPPESE